MGSSLSANMRRIAGKRPVTAHESAAHESKNEEPAHDIDSRPSPEHEAAELTDAQIEDATAINAQEVLPPELDALFVDEYSTNRYHIEFKGYLTNHTADVLLAMNKLGYPLPTIRKYLKWYRELRNLEDSSPLQKAPGSEEVNLSELSEIRGRRTNFYGIYQLMERDLTNPSSHDHCLASFINARFPAVSGGVAGALLHPLIHCGYGVSVMNRKMILEGISYLEHSSLPLEYSPSSEALSQHEGNLSVLEVLDRIRNEGKVEQCLADHLHEFDHLQRGGIQPAFICLSAFGQPLIAEYVAMFRKTVPSMTANYAVNRNHRCKELTKLKRYLLSLAFDLYAYSESLENSDFVLLHGVTAAWSLCQILVYLKEADDVNHAVMNFLCVLIAVFVVQREQSMARGREEAARRRPMWTKQTMARLALKLQNEAMDEVFRDEHVYKLLAVALDCFDDGFIDETTAVVAVRKAISFPLNVIGRGSRIKEDQNMHSV